MTPTLRRGCEVKILHSELFPGSSAVPMLSGVNAGGCTVRSLFPFFHLSTLPRFGVAP